MLRRFGWLRRNGAVVFGVTLMLAAIYVVQREFRSLSVAEIRTALAAIPPATLWLAGGWTVCAYLLLAVYDRLGSIYAGHKVSWPRSLLASFCGYALAHNLGFAAVSGAAVRYRLYAAWGLSPLEIAKVVGFTSLTFGLGGMMLGGLVLMLEPEVVPWLADHLPRWALQAMAIPLWGIVATYIVLSRFVQHVRLFRFDIALPSFRLALLQTLLATADVAITAAIFFTLLPEAEGLTFLRFVGIYLGAYSAGIIANVPGGLGVFDGAILLGLQPYLPAAEVVGALFVFRLYYYIVPLFIAGGLFASFELSQRRVALHRFASLGKGSEPLEVPAIASLVVLAGAVLLFLGALPVQGTALEAWVGQSGALASQFAASLVGSLLLVMAYGLLRRLALAFWATLLLLLTGAAICVLRGEAWWLWALFLLVAALLGAFRPAFYRRARLVREPLAPEALGPMVAVAVCGITLALVAHDARIAEASWWEAVLSDDAPSSLRFTVGLTAVLLLVGVARLLRRAPIAAAPWNAETRGRLAALGAAVPADADGAIFAEDGTAGIAFRRQDGVWVALGDPAGPPAAAMAAVWRFRDLCDRNGVEPAFVGIGTALERAYADIGLTLVPIADAADGSPRFLALRSERDVARLALPAVQAA
jgi:uncharacterized membrane protein YbhN (UPF0104 family)